MGRQIIEDEHVIDACQGGDHRRSIDRRNDGSGYWLGEHEIDDVYQETFCRLIRAVRKPNFDRTQPPMPFVQDVAWKAAYDWGRRRKRRTMESIDAAYEQIADDLKDTTVRREWLMVKADWPKFQKALDKIIDALPPKQKVAARAFLVSYEQLRKNDYSARRKPFTR